MAAAFARRPPTAAATPAQLEPAAFTRRPHLPPIYVANRNGLLSALERETGAPRWHTKLDAGPHTYIWGSPALAERDGLLVIGLSNRGTVDNGAFIPEQTLRTFRGAVIGVDAMTGQQVWRTETSPEPSGSGVGVWSSAAIERAPPCIHRHGQPLLSAGEPAQRCSWARLPRL